ncbi:ABC transporter ATP-binding protein [Stappia indica]|uniref:Iron complex transport system ATP-binding protein n=1 Tax=Stappia indica TaxID=538381 RepID=A0A285TSV3_9HYPH|nr:ABC transporter ATP-binding protein [Stappia indica]SOC27046.1 iron complex transport system ATP-binding protein [Stappia indica]
MIRLDCESVTVRRGTRETLRGISFSCDRPQLVGVIGPNGAGKSTLMRAMTGLQTHAGSIRWEGRELAPMPATERARLIAYMPQERTVHWPMDCIEVVLLGRLPHRGGFGGASADDLRHAREAMERMDVAGFARRPFDTLSGGEQARVLIARMLAQAPHACIADEPVNGLDPAHQIALMQVLAGLVAEGRPVFVSLHDLTLASRWCDRLLLLDRGRLVADGTPGEVLNAERLAGVYGIGAEHIDIGGRPSVVPSHLIAGERSEWERAQ